MRPKSNGPHPPRLAEAVSPRAILVGLHLPHLTLEDVTASLAELGRLLEALGIPVGESIIQRRPNATSPSVLGEGKLRELALRTGGPGIIPAAGRPNDPPPDLTNAPLVVVDAELNAGQLRNLETALAAQVLDRTAVILRIFELRAKTREARLEVEIARLLYETPRIRDNTSLGDREGGGTRGGRGHTEVELAKQRARERIAQLRRELESLRTAMESRRSRRKDALRVALVGYTNAGKSSLMRALTGSEVLVADQLFATLGTTVRVMQPETAPRILVADTVGFIKNLPHGLVASFRSTLDEAHDAGLLLLVVDAADRGFRAQLEVTRQVLGEIEADSIPFRVVLNKIDCVDAATRAALVEEFPDAIQVCAFNEEDVTRLREVIRSPFEEGMEEEEFLLPYARSALLSEVRAYARVVLEEYREDGVRMTLRSAPGVLARLRGMLRTA